MKTVAPDSLVGQIPRQRIFGGKLRLRAMEGGVETRDLRQRGMKFCQRRDGVEVMRLMQRRQRNETGQFRNDVRIDADRARIAHSAMHDAMPGRDQFTIGKARIEPAQECRHDLFMRRGLRQLLVGQAVSGAILRREMNPVAQSLVGAFANEVAPGRLLVRRKQRELDAR